MLPVISVVVTSYNHEQYISQCLDGILMQEGCPDYEIIIGDDCSTDNTRQIIQKYASEHQGKIIVVDINNNLGMYQNMKRCFELAKGKYIAMCEGDDFWINKHKLKMQYEYLEENQHLSMCANKVIITDKCENIPENTDYDMSALSKRVVNEHIYISEMDPTYNFSCCMYRMEAVKKIPESYYEGTFGNDWLFNIYVTKLYGDGVIYSSYSSVYRKHSAAQWSSLSDVEQRFQKIDCLYKMNDLLGIGYEDDIFEALDSIVREHKKKKNVFSINLFTVMKSRFVLELNKFKVTK